MHFSLVVLLALLIAGCVRAPVPLVMENPADPDARVTAVRHTSALQTYRSLRPVDPLSWREQNERVAPRPKE
jgi:PBP1b-binding outer membrane lipoprotein LpoB